MAKTKSKDQLILETKVNELEDTLSRLRDSVRDYVFQHLTSAYGTDMTAHTVEREAILDLFSSLYSDWDRL